ncbi:JmjC domain-containing protein [Streptomyces sp. NPDC059104]|uniref:JmjC domain-containing protein n=1 Tax=Streptomyces sp. NPDC059104 TaxID=3346729 RepID=UPI0036942323
MEEEFDLEPGSVLYLPRGTVHAATSTDTASLHLILGVHPVLLPAILGEAVRDLAEDDEALRRGLPIGFASDEGRRREAERMIEGLPEAVRTRLTPRELTDRAVKGAVSIAPPVLRGHLTDLDRPGRLLLVHTLVREGLLTVG